MTLRTLWSGIASRVAMRPWQGDPERGCAARGSITLWNTMLLMTDGVRV